MGTRSGYTCRKWGARCTTHICPWLWATSHQSLSLLPGLPASFSCFSSFSHTPRQISIGGLLLRKNSEPAAAGAAPAPHPHPHPIVAPQDAEPTTGSLFTTVMCMSIIHPSYSHCITYIGTSITGTSANTMYSCWRYSQVMETYNQIPYQRSIFARICSTQNVRNTYCYCIFPGVISVRYYNVLASHH